MRGIYLFNLSFNNLKEVLNIKNLSFVWVASKNTKYLNILKQNNVKIFYPFGVLTTKTPFEKRYTAVDKTGKKIPTFAGWYTGVCPNNPHIIRRRLQSLKRFMASDEARYYDGVYLDAIRYPTYWEDNPVKYLDTCYCNTCLKLFANQSCSWEDFRIDSIEKLIIKIKAIAKGKQLGYFAVPESEHHLVKIFAQPPQLFSTYFDLVSPMIYPQMVGKDVQWAIKTIKSFRKYYKDGQIISIIQTSKMPENSSDKFVLKDCQKLAHLVKDNGNIGYFALDLLKPPESKTKADFVNTYL